MDNNIFPLANQVTVRPSSSHQRSAASGKEHHHQQQHHQHQMPTSGSADELAGRPDKSQEETKNRKATQVSLRPAKSSAGSAECGALLLTAFWTLLMTVTSWWPNAALVGHLATPMT